MATQNPSGTEEKPKTKTIPWTWMVIVAASILTIYVSSTFDWFKQNEHVAIWLEGVALVLIFGLDLINGKEEHKETIEQLKAATHQAEFTEKAADEAKKSSDILASLHRPLMGIGETPIRVDNINVPMWRISTVAKNFGTLLATGVSVTAEIFIDGALRMTEPVGEVVEVFPGQAFSHLTVFDTGQSGRVQINSGAQALTAKIKITYRDQSQRSFVYLADAKFIGGFLHLTRTATTELSTI
jgi:hypothetical protein